MTEFKILDLLKIFPINRNTFQSWLMYEFIYPSIHKPEKQGDDYIFNLLDLLAIHIFIEKSNFMRRKNAALFSNCLYDPLNEDGFFSKISHFFSDNNDKEYLICHFSVNKMGHKIKLKSIINDQIEKYFKGSNSDYFRYKLNDVRIVTQYFCE